MFLHSVTENGIDLSVDNPVFQLVAASLLILLGFPLTFYGKKVFAPFGVLLTFLAGAGASFWILHSYKHVLFGDRTDVAYLVSFIIGAVFAVAISTVVKTVYWLVGVIAGGMMGKLIYNQLEIAIESDWFDAHSLEICIGCILVGGLFGLFISKQLYPLLVALTTSALGSFLMMCGLTLIIARVMKVPVELTFTDMFVSGVYIRNVPIFAHWKDMWTLLFTAGWGSLFGFGVIMQSYSQDKSTDDSDFKKHYEVDEESREGCCSCCCGGRETAATKPAEERAI